MGTQLTTEIILMMFCLAFIERSIALWEDQSAKIRGVTHFEKTLVLCGTLQAGQSNLSEMLTIKAAQTSKESGTSDNQGFDTKALLESAEWNSFKQRADDFCRAYQPDWLGYGVQLFQLGGGVQPFSWTFRPKKEES